MRQSRITPIVLTVALLAITALVYAPVHDHGFVNYDDPLYVEDNPWVHQGLSWDGVVWAFTTGHASNWHPLTWLSHMLDVELHGLDPGGHHVTNLLLHLAATLALLLALSHLTRRFDLSLIVASLFALHPTHVESVAWISERKDVLSGLFFGLTLWAYSAYVRQPSRRRYALLLLAFALGLLSKPMLVTVPFLLLLLDIWPLDRLALTTQGEPVSTLQRLRSLLTARQLWWEKAPLFLLVVISSIVTYRVQQVGGAVSDLEQLPFLARVANAAVALIGYLGKLVWPVDLGVLYPHPGLPTVATLLGALALLVGLSWIAWKLAPRHPFVLVGWLWFVGMLVPVLGFVQVGVQAMADRYTYLPYTGLFIALVWGVDAWLSQRQARSDIPAGSKNSPAGSKKSQGHKRKSKAREQAIAPTGPVLPRPALQAAAVVVLLALSVLTYRQVQRWQDSLTLFQHTLDVTGPNHHMHNIVGITLLKQGQVSEALPHFEEAVRIRPNFARAHNNLGIVAQRQSRLPAALDHFHDAARFNPVDPEARVNQANVLGDLGRLEDALVAYREAIDLDPEDAEIHHNLALTLAQAGRRIDALPHFERAAQLAQDDATLDATTRGRYWGDLANSLSQNGRAEEAEATYRRAIDQLRQVKTDEAGRQLATVQRNLGTLLAKRQRVREAAEAFQAAVQADPNDTRARALLILALATDGKQEAALIELNELEARAPDMAAALRQELQGRP